MPTANVFLRRHPEHLDTTTLNTGLHELMALRPIRTSLATCLDWRRTAITTPIHLRCRNPVCHRQARHSVTSILWVHINRSSSLCASINNNLTHGRPVRGRRHLRRFPITGGAGTGTVLVCKCSSSSRWTRSGGSRYKCRWKSRSHLAGAANVS
jgi:hypothetical protein